MASEATELPPVVVEGATVEKPKVKVTPSRAAAQAAVVPGPAPVDAGASAAATSSAAGEAVTVTGVPADEIGQSVTIVTNAQLKAQEVRHAADALRSLPGVSVSRTGGFGSITQVRIRGAESNHTLVLIDGIDAADGANGEFDFSNLLVEDIDRIEVIRGGQSGIGGARAIGGVINIITKGGKGPLTFAARAEGGSFKTHDLAARVSAGSDDIWFAFGGNVRESNGFNISEAGNENDPTRVTNFFFKGGAVLFPGVTLDLSLRKISKDIEYDDFGFRPGTPYGVAVDGTPYNHTDIWLGGAQLTWDSLDGALTQVIKGNRNETSSHDDDPNNPFPFGYKGEAIKYGYASTYRFGADGFRNALTGLVQREEESFSPLGQPERNRARWAYVGEYRTELFDRLFPTVSVRRDDNDSFTSYTTWNAGLSVSLKELGMRPHATVGSAVSLPSMFEQFGSTSQFHSNPSLKPEESFGWDAGVEFSFLKGSALLDVTYFRSELTNEIGRDLSQVIYTPKNFDGESTRDGVEVSGRVLVTRDLSLGASYTYLEAFQPDGMIEVRRPRHSGRADINYAFDAGRANVNVAAIYNGAVEDDVFDAFFAQSRATLDQYWVVNVAASYKLTSNAEIYGRIENLLDEQYEEVYGYNTPGISAYAGIRFSYEELATKAWSQGKK